MAEQKPYMIKRDGTFVERATGQVLGRVWLEADGWHADNPRHQFGPNWTKWTVAREAWQDWQKIVSTPSPGELRVQEAKRTRVGAHVLDNLEARATMDLKDSAHPSVASRVPARMLLSIVTELREARQNHETAEEEADHG